MDSVLFLDVNGSVLGGNDAACNGLGYTQAELESLHFLDINVQLQEADFSQCIEQLKVVGSLALDSWYRTKAGKEFPVQLSVSLLTLAGTQHIVAIAKDLSGPVAVPPASPQFAQRIADTSPNILYIYDLETQQNIYANCEITVMLGYAPAQIQAMGEDFLQRLIHPEDWPTVVKHHLNLRSIKEHQIVQLEYRIQDAQGKWHWLHSRETAFLRNDKTALVKQIIGSATDITDRKQSQLALERQLKREQILSHITHQIRQSLDSKEILATTAPAVRMAFRASRCSIYTAHTCPHPYFALAFYDYAPEYAGEGPSTLDSQVHDYAHRLYRQEQALVIHNIHDQETCISCRPTLDTLAIKSLLGIRTSCHGQVNGAIILSQCDDQRHWTPEDVLFIEAVAAQVGIALAQAQLHEQEHQQRMQLEHQNQQLSQEVAERQTAEAALAQQLQEARLCAALTQVMRQSLDTETLFQTTVTEMRRQLAADRVGIFQFEPVSGHKIGTFVAEAVLPNYTPALGQRVTDGVFGAEWSRNYHPGYVYHCANIDSANLMACHLEMLARFDIQANLILPLFLGHRLWGLLCIHQCDAPRQWHATEISFAQTISIQLSVALQQAQLFEQTHQRTVQLQGALAEVQVQQEREAKAAALERATIDVIRQIRQSLDVTEIMNTATQVVRESLGCDRSVLYQGLETGIYAFASESVSPGWPTLDVILERDQWLPHAWPLWPGTGDGAASVLAIADLEATPPAADLLTYWRRLQIRALMVVPVQVGADHWGLLSAYQNSTPRTWDPRECQFLEQVAEQVGVAIQQAELLQQVQLARDHADAANRAKSDFLANVSHELRTPLNAIIGFSQLLKQDASLHTAQQQHLRIIHRSGEHLLALINDVLTMAKLEAGKTVLTVAPIDLDELLDSVQALLRPKADAKGLKFMLVRDVRVPRYLRTDGDKLRQVLIHLLDNAVKFTATGQVILRVSTIPLGTGALPQPLITIAGRQPLFFAVEDTGIGIAAPELNFLFEAFLQTEQNSAHHHGVGLGLPISHRFIQLLGGKLQVSSQVGQGSVFSFFMQVEPTTTMVPFKSPPDQRVASVAEGQTPYRILVAAPSSDTQQLLAQQLERTGFEVQSVAHLPTTVEITQRWHPHLIVVNAELLDKDGLTLLQQISATPGAPKIIVLTPTDRQDGEIAAMCDDTISVPFTDSILYETLRQQLGVQYQYAAPPTTDSPPPNLTCLDHTAQRALTTGLATMPRSWLEALKIAAMGLEEERVMTLLKALPVQEQQLHSMLTFLVNDFHFDTILEVVEPYL